MPHNNRLPLPSARLHNLSEPLGHIFQMSTEPRSVPFRKCPLVEQSATKRRLHAAWCGQCWSLVEGRLAWKHAPVLYSLAYGEGEFENHQLRDGA